MNKPQLSQYFQLSHQYSAQNEDQTTGFATIPYQQSASPVPMPFQTQPAYPLQSSQQIQYTQNSPSAQQLYNDKSNYNNNIEEKSISHLCFPICGDYPTYIMPISDAPQPGFWPPVNILTDNELDKKMEYTVEQKVWCVVWYGMSESPTTVQREYRKKFGRSAHIPNDKSIRQWFDKIMDTGSVNNKPKTKTKWVRTKLKVEEVLAKFREDPHISPRSLARNEGMPSRSSIQRILKEAKFHPYKLQHPQKLRPVDYETRVVHATSQLDLTQEFFGRILFSDEAHFHIHGHVNHQNFRYWSDKNPGWYREEPLHSPRVSVWAAIGRQGVVGPVFFHNNVTAASYLELLQQRFLPVVQTWPGFASLIFMQDGAPIWATL